MDQVHPYSTKLEFSSAIVKVICLSFNGTMKVRNSAQFDIFPFLCHENNLIHLATFLSLKICRNKTNDQTTIKLQLLIYEININFEGNQKFNFLERVTMRIDLVQILMYALVLLLWLDTENYVLSIFFVQWIHKPFCIKKVIIGQETNTNVKFSMLLLDRLFRKKNSKNIFFEFYIFLKWHFLLFQGWMTGLTDQSRL